MPTWACSPAHGLRASRGAFWADVHDPCRVPGWNSGPSPTAPGPPPVLAVRTGVSFAWGAGMCSALTPGPLPPVLSCAHLDPVTQQPLVPSGTQQSEGEQSRGRRGSNCLPGRAEPGFFHPAPSLLPELPYPTVLAGRLILPSCVPSADASTRPGVGRWCLPDLPRSVPVAHSTVLALNPAPTRCDAAVSPGTPMRRPWLEWTMPLFSPPKQFFI